jgi:hypothetical protein
MTAPFSVRPFSAENLYEQLSSYCTAIEIAKKYQSQYMARYLDKIGAKTIVTENFYVDRDYLDDFSQFYVKCFERYDHICKRLHFFSQDFSDEALRGVINRSPDSDEEGFRNSYLGFMVARPVPDAVIGRTALKTYPSDNDRRHYTGLRSYSSNLFGIDLSVDSLAFQEQDKALAACATVALWSCFHKASQLFQTTTPTPAEITRAANRLVNQVRPIPSHGLEVHQMCTAIRHIGLEPEVIEPKKNVPLNSLIYSHLRFGNPVLLGVEIEGLGLHAVTLAGYSLLPHRHLQTEVSAPHSSIPLVGLRINEFYAHDDQTGPFSRLKVVQVADGSRAIKFENERYVLNGAHLAMRPTVVVVPVYNKIRLGFMRVYEITTQIAAVFEFLGSLLKTNSDQFEWDLHIVSSNAFKKKLRANPANIPGPELLNALTKAHPRFGWRILLRFQGKRIIELLADTTAMEKSDPIYDLTWRDPNWKEGVKGIFAIAEISPRIRETLGAKLFATFQASFDS